MPYEALKPVPFGGLDDRDALTLDETKSPNMRNVRGDRDRVERGPGAALFAAAPIPSVTAGQGSNSGTFTSATSTGTQSFAHGLGATPVAVLFFAVRTTTTGSYLADSYSCVGMSDGTTSRAMASAAGDASSLSTVYRRRYASACLTMIDTAGTLLGEAAWSAWDATNITIDWTTADATAWTVHWVAFGGTGFAAEVVETTLNTSTGNQSNTATAFTPDCVIHMCSAQTATGTTTGLQPAIGVMCSDGTQWSVSAAQSGPTTLGRNGTTSAALESVTSGGAIDFSLAYVSMNANGFTVNLTNAPGSAYLMASLCIDGLSSVTATSINRTLASGPVDQSVPLSFEPRGFLFASHWSTAGIDTGYRNFALGTGTAGGTGTGSMSGSRSVSPSDTYRSQVTDAFAIQSNATSTSTPTGHQSKTKLTSVSSAGMTVTHTTNTTAGQADLMCFLAWAVGTTSNSEVGTVRNYGQVYVGATGTEKLLMLTDKGISVWNTSTEVFDVSSESYTITAGRRFYVANTQDAAVWAVDANASAPNLRHYDGSSFADLITSGTNHAAKFCIAFNDRIVSGYTYHTAAVHPTQLRWCRSGSIRNWDTSTGSAGTVEAIEHSSAPLTGMFVMGDRGYVTKEREIIELIPTGSLAPTFRQATRVFGTGCIAPYSFGSGEFFTFMLGPDNVFLFDGSSLKPIGEDVRRTISALLDYTNLDDVQGAYLQATGEYILRIGVHLFIYDLNADRWFRDQIADQTAIGVVRVGGIITTDVDHSEFLVMGTSGNTTLRVSENLTTILDGAIDSYVETKDFYAIRPVRGGDRDKDRATATVRSKNMMTSVAVHTDPSATIEIGVSTDRGSTWDVADCTADADGIAQRWVIKPYQQIRFRFRSNSTGDFKIYGAYSYRWDTAGMVVGP